MNNKNYIILFFLKIILLGIFISFIQLLYCYDTNYGFSQPSELTQNSNNYSMDNILLGNAIGNSASNNYQILSGQLSDGDNVLPVGSVTINSGATYTNSTLVNLTISASDIGSGISQMRIFNAGSSGTWEDYSESKSWSLSAGDGKKIIYIEFKDAAGNISIPAHASIFLDTTAPSAYSVGTIGVGNNWVQRNVPGKMGGVYWNDVALSSDGLKLAAVAGSPGYIYTSIDGGKTWIEQRSAGRQNWATVASSADGNKLAAATMYSGYINTSSDGGITWQIRTGSGSRNWKKIVSSSDGTKLAAAVSNGYIYTSNDSGATWQERTAAGSKYWYSIASSSDGSKISALVYDGYVYTSDDSGTTWVTSNASGKRRWQSICSSSDGNKLAAPVTEGYIYTSIDRGNTWVTRNASGTKSWRNIACSADGNKLAAVVEGGYIYTSNDSGANWTERTSVGSGRWMRIASNSDGNKIIAANQGGYIFTSIDSGATWEERSSAGNRYWISVASSIDGSKIAGCINNGYIYTSSDSGQTWAENISTGMKTWQNIVSSDDGTKLAACAYGNYIYTSDNGGTTWVQRTSAGSRNWVSLYCSADGTKIIAGDQNSYVYTSTNGGSSWTTHTSLGSKYWNGVAMSADGTKLAAAAYNGNIYTSIDSGSTWATKNAVGKKNWSKITMSADGSIISAATSTYIHTSLDSGETWTTGNINTHIIAITSSSDGTKLGAASMYTNLYVSTDGGNIWEVKAGAGSGEWRGIDTIDNGNKYVAVKNPDGVYSSLYESIIINTANVYTTTRNVTLKLDSVDVGSGVAEMRVYDNLNSGTWETYSTAKPWTIGTGEGVHTVNATFRDALGQTSSMAYDTIILNEYAPTNTGITINSGAVYTTTTNVSLLLNTVDALEMRVFDNNNSGSWETYKTSKTWTLNNLSGLKTVGVVFRDIAGFISATVNDTIILDTTQPTTDAHIPEKNATGVMANTNISFYIYDKETDVNTQNMELLINNTDKIASATITLTSENAVVGSAVNFDGNEDYVSIPDSTDWDFNINTSWSVEMWIYPRILNSTVIYGRSADDNLNGGENYLAYQTYAPPYGLSWGPINAEWDTGLTLQTNQWQYVAVVYNANTQKAYCYVNGTTSTNVNVSTIGSSSGVFKIADNYNVNGLNGRIDEFRIYKNKALTPTEINNSYQRGLKHLANNVTDGLVAYLPFDKNANDELGNHNGTLQDNTIVTGNAGWKIVYNPSTDFAYGLTVNVTINAQNLSGTTMTDTYWFKTYKDYTPPTATAFVPAKYSTEQAINSDISFFIFDKESDIDTNNMSLLVNNQNKISSASIVSTGNKAMVGSALALDGTNDYIEAADSTDWDFDLNTSWSVELWAYPKSIAGNILFYGRSPDDTLNGGENYLYYSTTYGIGWGPINTEWRSGRSLSANQWQHIAMVYDSTAQKAYCYINGSGSEVNVTSVGSSSGAFKLGDNYNGTFFNGYLDEFKVYKNKALSSTEVNSAYQRGLKHMTSETTQGLVAYWSFDKNGTDESGENHTVTFQDNAQVTGNAGWKVVYNPDQDFPANSTVNVTINAQNLTGTMMQPEHYWFKILKEDFADVIFTNRIAEIVAPTSNGYTGNNYDLVPGSKIKYYVIIKNQGNITANNYYIRDFVPVNTHLYYTGEPPTLNGDVINIEYLGATENGGPNAEIKFKYDLPPEGVATFSFTLTVD